MPTLFEILSRKISPEPAQESQVYNPIGMKIGGLVTIDDLDYRGHQFVLKALRSSELELGREKFQFADYDFLSRPIGADELAVRLRISQAQREAQTLTVLLLALYHEQEFSQEIRDICENSRKTFVVNQGQSDEETYWRVGDVGLAYHALHSHTLSDKDGDGTVQADEKEDADHQFWDYSRITQIDGVDVEQFFIVEMSTFGGWIQMWRGVELAPEKLQVF